jgi:uncharacterized membrane-anchored protein
MTTATARVYVNNVEVGALPVEHYRRMVAEVRKERWLYLAQLGNLLSVAMNILTMMLRMFPILLCAPLLAMAALSPETMTAVIELLRTAAAAEITHTLQSYLSIITLLTFFSVFIAAVFSNFRFGYVDQFDLRINERLRTLMEVPAEGSVTVIHDVPRNDK